MNGKYDVADIIASLEQERDQLKAQLNAFNNLGREFDRMMDLVSSRYVAEQIYKIELTPAASLSNIQAKAIEDFGKQYAKDGLERMYTGFSVSQHAEATANKLRQQSKVKS